MAIARGEPADFNLAQAALTASSTSTDQLFESLPFIVQQLPQQGATLRIRLDAQRILEPLNVFSVRIFFHAASPSTDISEHFAQDHDLR